MKRQLIRLTLAFALAVTGAAALVWACGPDAEELVTAAALHPAAQDAYAAGEIGIVRPNYARRYLLNAYRILNGTPPLLESSGRQFELSPYVYRDGKPAEAWRAASAAALGEPAPPTDPFAVLFATERLVPGSDYQVFENCLDESLASAVRTLTDRQAQYGAASAEVREWARAQNLVFYNCGNAKTVMVPRPLPPGAAAGLRADRAYQIAAAHFYGMQYDEAARLFTAIAADRSSPWRTFGRYLAGRARIRQATLTSDAASRPRLFALADAELSATLADAEAEALHESARGLRRLIEDRDRPLDRLRALTTQLTTGATAGPRDFEDYTRLLDRFVGDTTDIGVARIDPALLATGDANDWVLTFQARDNAAIARAVQRWETARTLPWLIAALSKVPPDHAAATAVLAAAAEVPVGSPGYATITFLRVRLHAWRAERREARAILAALPREPRPAFDVETINFFRAQRLMLADTIEEFLDNATRRAVYHPNDRPVFDSDTGDAMTYHFPIERLIEATRSPTLPRRLRERIGGVALARTIVLNAEELGRGAAAAWRAVARAELHGDIDRYLKATTAGDRQWAAVVLMLRTPGLHAYVAGPEYAEELTNEQPTREFDRMFHENWWCVPEQGEMRQRWSEYDPLRVMLHGRRPVAAPAFLTAAETAAAAGELAQLRKAGNAREWLATEVLAAAQSRPADPLLAEALHRVVLGGRYSHCRDPRASALSRRAFQTLHRLFPKSEWAQRTRYWYG